MTRVAVCDLGTNSTRLLIAEVDTAGRVEELARESTVTRLGDKLGATGRLDDAAVARVFAVLERYRAEIDRHDVAAVTAVLTSAVRDAANGPQFAHEVRERFALPAQTISGDREAALTFRGATGMRPADGSKVVVIDMGGGSTELAIGTDGEVEFSVSTQLGVVRQTELHVHHDPPRPAELAAIAKDARQVLAAAVPADRREGAQVALAVAGTATSAAAIAQDLEVYDRSRVHGTFVPAAELTAQLERLAAMPEARRRTVRGLHPDRAPLIVTGLVIMREALALFGLDGFEASEHDILHGAAIELAAAARA